MPSYYCEQLSADRLRRCYQLATPRVQQYLDAEISHVESRIRPSDRVLELGCGYGRVMERLAGRTGALIGVDTSASSLLLARENLKNRAQSGDANQYRDRNRLSEYRRLTTVDRGWVTGARCSFQVVYNIGAFVSTG